MRRLFLPCGWAIVRCQMKTSNWIYLVGGSLLVVVLIPHSTNAAKPDKARADSASKDNAFTPCKLATKMTATLKKRLLKMGVSLASMCGLRIASVIQGSWGSVTKILLFIPRFKKLYCLNLRVTYATMTDERGLLPPALAQNASRLYDLSERIFSTLLRDVSISPDVCVRTREESGPTKQTCYTRKQLLAVAETFMPCLRDLLKESTPPHVDGAIFYLNSMFRAAETNGIVTFIGR